MKLNFNNYYNFKYIRNILDYDILKYKSFYF